MIPGTIRYQDRWKWLLPAPRSSLNLPGPRGKAKSLLYGTRHFTKENQEQILNFLIIVIHAQIACEIDIRTLTSHQVLGQILDQIFGQVFEQVFGQISDQIFDQVLDQGFWTRKYSVQFY